MNRTTPDRDPAVMDLTRRTALASRDNLRGQFPIERMAPALYFTADLDGDEALVSDRYGAAASPLHDQIEALAGAQLVRRTDCDSDGVLVLGFSADTAAGVLERLDWLDATSGEGSVAQPTPPGRSAVLLEQAQRDAAQRVFEDYDFGPSERIEASTGWEHTVATGHWTRNVYLATIGTSPVRPSRKVTMNVRFAPGTALVIEGCAIGADGAVVGGRPFHASVLAIAPQGTQIDLGERCGTAHDHSTAEAIAVDALWEPRLQTTGHRCEVRVRFLDVDDDATEPRT
ncbi:MAG: hypothetical protein L6Q68_15150 [Aquabacterium sp.]|nr:hypothetical protein [Aquabacterium sp.]